MSVVRRAAQRRWLLVGGAVALLCLTPSLVAALPVSHSSTGVGALREKILASSARPYSGYAESRGTLGLPDLPQLGDVAALLGGTTRIRAWYASSRQWRVDVIEPTGERDLYQTPQGTVLWDYERNRLTEVDGNPPVRLPRAADLLPAELARRLLRSAAPGDTVRRIGDRRVAGIDAAGLRLSATDPDTTVEHVDVWADPADGLPLEVQAFGRGDVHPVLVSRFLDLHRGKPSASALTPTRPAGAGRVSTQAPDIATALGSFAPYPLPDRLAGRAKLPLPVDFSGVAGYGRGFSTVVVLPLPGRLGLRSFENARDAAATPVALTHGRGMLVRTSLLTALVARSDLDDRTFLLTGLVTPGLLQRAGSDLLATSWGAP